MNAQAIYSHFKSKPGSDFIATSFALDELYRWIKRKEPKRILEIGAGIGTMTYALCEIRKEFPFELISIEWNEFCISELNKNLFDFDYTLVRSIEDVSGSFDIILIDGGEQDNRFISSLERNGIIFIEGFMDKKHRLIRDYYKKSRNYVSANFRSRDRTAGIFIFQFEPTNYDVSKFALTNLKNRCYSTFKRLGLTTR